MDLVSIIINITIVILAIAFIALIILYRIAIKMLPLAKYKIYDAGPKNNSETDNTACNEDSTTSSTSMQ